MRPKYAVNLILIAIVIFFGFAASANAATYFVATTGDDANPGTVAAPFRTIQKGANALQPGDTLIVAEGVYRERIDMPRSGVAGNPITLQGEVGAIVDGGDIFTGWEAAPEIGGGVYKKVYVTGSPDNIPYNPYSMTWNDKYILRINNTLMADGRGFDLLRMPGLDPRWNGVEAWFGYLNGVTYVRFRNGENPENEPVRFAPILRGAVNIDGKNFIVIKGFTIKNADNAVRVVNGASDNIIEDNLLLGGRNTVSLNVNASRNHVRLNEITLNYIYEDFGHPWRSSAEAYNIFDAIKNKGPSNLRGVEVFQAGSDNQIYRNHIFKHFDGVDHYSGGDLVPGVMNSGIDRETHAQFNQRLKIYENTIHNIYGGIQSIDGGVDVEIHDNLIYETTENIRIKRVTKGPLYIYRNRLYNITQKTAGGTPEGYGLYISPYDDADTPGIMYFYHNSSAIAGSSITFSATDPAAPPPTLGLPNFWFLNNVFSDINFWGTFQTNWSDVLKAHFDYNWVGGNIASTTWPSVQHNVFSPGQTVWPDRSNPSFQLYVTSTARLAGIDLSQPFTIDGVTVGPLPGMTPGYFSGTRPDAGAIQFIPPPDNAPPSAPTNLAAKIISETQVNLSWTASTDDTGVLGYKIFRNSVAVAATSAIAYADTGLTPGTSYTYSVSAYDTTGKESNQSDSVTVTLTPDTTPPTVAITEPRDGATVSGLTRISVSASDDRVLAGVRFLIDGKPFLIEDRFPPYTLLWNTTVVPNGAHTLATQARDTSGNLTTSTAITVTVANPITADTTPPSSPTDLRATAISSSRIDLVWTAASDNVGLAGYRLYRTQTSGGCTPTTNTLCTEFGTTISTTYADTSLTAATTYSYVVLAYDAAGNVSPNSNQASATTMGAGNGGTGPDTQPPSTPVNLAASAVSPNQINLSWSPSTDNAGVAGYAVYREGVQIMRTTETTYADIGLAASRSYTYTVSAFDAALNESRQSPPVTATTPAATLSVALTALPPSGEAPLRDVTLRANVSGNVGATVTYTFYCNRPDAETTITLPYDAQFLDRPNKIWFANSLCDYEIPGTYTAKVVVESSGQRAEASTVIQVGAETPTAEPSLTLTKNLGFGMRDSEVTQLQAFLKRSGYFPAGEDTTTFFGRLTLQAVISYQKARGIEPAAGFMGPRTRAVLAGGATPSPPPPIGFMRILYLWLRGEDVLALQRKLQMLGFFPASQEPTGYFGRVTEAAVKSFQCAKGIVCEGNPTTTGYGVVGPRTKELLNKLQ